MRRRSALVPASVAALAVEVAEWRRHRRHVREKVPDELMAKLVEAAKETTVATVASGVKMDRAVLLAGMARLGDEPPARGRPVIKLLPIGRAESLSAPQAVGEITRPTGERLRIFGADVAQVVRAFLEVQA